VKKEILFCRIPEKFEILTYAKIIYKQVTIEVIEDDIKY
jgi:hypothetical protein